ncbi:MAG TPA: hypothetical protein VGP83_16925 [Pyrinomonadaceae bacterium]|jgi:hypothetical protein|nr:hypothetical protein [Pyrinomonadaceae bacterium]
MTGKKTIADKLIEKVEIRLDGVNWPIVITHNVLIDCEALTGLNVLTGEANIVRPSATLIRALLYLALKRAGATYTLEQIGDLIGPQNIALLQEGLLKAWAASMPPEDDTADPTQAVV